MAYYSYYNSQPAWGTQQYQAIAPPMPQYQPQPSWGGADYYRAHANGTDNSIFDYVWFKLKDLVVGTGVGRNEAAHWWKRVYGGLVNPSMLLPRELGAAAGFEAIRCWEQHKSVYAQPLSQDRGREREALIGLAAAEASKLCAYTQRPLDKYGRLEASEVAASTASRIFVQSYNYDSPYDSYDRYPRMRRRSISSTRYDAGGFRSDNYLDDNDDLSDSDYLDTYPRGSYQKRQRDRYRRNSMSYYHYPSSSTALDDGIGGGIDNFVGLSSSVVSYPAQYANTGTYYPNVAHPGNLYGYGGTSPYLNRSYAGSSVGLPPPPMTSNQYLATPGMTHRRAHSTGAFGSTRPYFGF